MIKLAENDNFIVEHDVSNKIYRVSYFEDNHFKDEFVFAISHVKEPVRHGKWNTFKSTVGDMEMYAVRCSCCNEAPLSKPFQGWVESAYCPHCGAKMDGD